MNIRHVIIILLAVAIAILARHRFPKDRMKDDDVLKTPGPYPAQPVDPFPAPTTSGTGTGGSEKPVELTAVARELGPRLNAPDGSVGEDLDILNSLLAEYRRAHGSNPVGLNEDITPVLTGQNKNRAAYLPPDHPAIDPEKNLLLDRWGTPFYFHPVSGTEMEIRSAGPDKELFTDDDIQLE